MNSYVLDASAILAVLNDERGAEAVLPVLPGATVCAVNSAEVAGKLADLGMVDTGVRSALDALPVTIEPFDHGLALITGMLRATTRQAGLSLGDRACLALALREKATVLTADRSWQSLGLSVRIEVIR